MEFEYEIKNSSKSRHVRISVYPNGRVVVTKPDRISPEIAAEFVRAKENWIKKKIEKYRKVVPLPASDKTKSEILQFVKNRLAFYNDHYKYEIGEIRIKKQKSLWGSASKNKNLNFNQNIAALPLAHADYIIVHELCHLKQLNHSKEFWNLVSETIPNYKTIKHQLRNYIFF